MVVAVGEERTVSIESGTSFASHIVWSQLAVHSSDEGLLQVTAHPNTGIPATVRGLHPGRAFVSGADDRRYVTVTVVECPTVSLEQSPASVATRPGKPVSLTVVPHGYQWSSLQWFEERRAIWEPIPFATVTGYTFTPRAGTYRFQARYQDRCGDATATFLVNATDRVRAAR
jgi:hypothetical protein